MKNLKERLLGLFFPPRCAVCGEVLTMKEREGYLCETCATEIPYISEEKCPHCGSKTDTAGFCDFCVKPYAFEGAYAAFPYEKVRKSIHLFKFSGGKKIGEGLGQLMAEYLLKYHDELLVKTDVILSVPLHPKKEKRRGFDQTYLLCRILSEKTNLIYLDRGLSRKRDTVPQSMLSPEERKENLRGVFKAEADVAGKRVLLVDDIFTTGTTCNECAKVLYRAGAKEVMVFCLAVAGAKAD